MLAEVNRDCRALVGVSEAVELDIRGIGSMRRHVRDPLRRTWEKGIYMGEDSTNPDAIKRNRPPAS